MARSFNGTTDHIDTASTFAVPAAGTLSCWVKRSALSNSYNGIIGNMGSSSVFFEALLKSSGQFAYYCGATSTVSVDPGAITTSSGIWYHVALSYDSVGGLKTFVNGSSDGTAAASGALNTTASPFSIGYDAVNTGRNFPGSIADAAEWNVALTAAEISALARGARPYTIRPSALLIYLPLDGLQSPEPDLSGNARNGTLTGTALASGPPLMMFTPRWTGFVPQPPPMPQVLMPQALM